MNQKSIIGSKKVPSTLVRPQYSPGLLLNDDDLGQAVDYTRELNRMLFRSLLGCGVVCGLLVKANTACGKLVVTVEPGLALDCHGDPLHLPDPCTVTVDPTCGAVLPGTVWVLARRYDKHCAPRSAVCAPDDDDAASVCTRIRDGVEISVAGELPDCACGCPPKTDATAATGGDTKPKAAAGSPKPKAGAAAAAAGADQDETAGDPSSAADPCYEKHYGGICDTCCGDDCACEWLVLARLGAATDGTWTADHAVRRFIRPMLMADPQPELERKAKT